MGIFEIDSKIISADKLMAIVEKKAVDKGIVDVFKTVKMGEKRKTVFGSVLLKYDGDEFVEKAYSELLGREADIQGKEHFLSLYKIGKLSKEDIIYTLYTSVEGKKYAANLVEIDFKRLSLDELLNHDGEEFIDNAYYWILRRQADVEAKNHILNCLNSGEYEKIEVLYSLWNSDEGKKQKVEIPYLKKIYVRRKIKRKVRKIPLFGRIFRGIYRWINSYKYIVILQDRLNEMYDTLENRNNDIRLLYESKYEELNSKISIYDNKMNQLAELQRRTQASCDDLLAEVGELIKKNSAELIKVGQSEERIIENIAVISRQLMAYKWKLIDLLSENTESEEDILTCDICGSSHRRSEYQILSSSCVFNGGKLTRYVCPECGVIFGPSKFLEQGQQGIDEDYVVHYLGFSEGDSAYKEEMAFRALNPQKNMTYLNYGCGKWSKTLQKLRAEGFDVYGYEPYAPESDNPYMITTKEELSKMRFNGIFSNDLLEHLINPIQDMQFMGDLLVDSDSIIAHSTACFTYKYEYTRFHTHFFLGNSVDIMAKKSNLEVVGKIDELENCDFICYLFRKCNSTRKSILDKMCILKNGSFSQEGIIIKAEGIVCGPYFGLASGKYVFEILVDDADRSGTINYRITCDKGVNLLAEGVLNRSSSHVEIEISEFKSNVEVVITNNTSSEIVLKDIIL